MAKKDKQTNKPNNLLHKQLERNQKIRDVNIKIQEKIDQFINQITESCQLFFNKYTINGNGQVTFRLNDKNNLNRYVISGSPLTKAINNDKNDQLPINVLEWFDDFWLYLAINFDLHGNLEDYLIDYNGDIDDIDDNDVLNISFTLSVFQGLDEKKKQLFRAEWDNFKDNSYHPQPHWHIHQDYYLNKLSDEATEFKNERTKDESFLSLIIEENYQAAKSDLKIQEIHFAMNGSWTDKKGHIHTIKLDDYLSFVNWLIELLTHIRSQLEFIKRIKK